MSESSSAKVPRPASSLYVGPERCEQIRRFAIEISYHTGENVSASQFSQYLVDKYLEDAKAELINQLKKGGDTSMAKILGNAKQE